ncbi:MAG: DUF2975 domain-containing protein [Bacteroides sp.]|nr:DUF2975 domain-containing protein [Bacteroides sp.]
MKLNIRKSKGPKIELTSVMSCLSTLCAVCVLIVFTRNLTLCYQLGKDDTDDFIWRMISESITLLAMAVCSVLIYVMLRNVKAGRVFTMFNANLILGIGFIIVCNGFIQGLLQTCIPELGNGMAYIIYLLLGVFFLLISCLFKVGIRMQEEQDLTI